MLFDKISSIATEGLFWYLEGGKLMEVFMEVLLFFNLPK